MLLPLHVNGLNLDSATAVVALTGTATAGLTEAQVDAGGATFIWRLTNDTFLAAGTGPIGSIANTQALIDNIVSDGAETFGWNNIRSGIAVTDVTRDSSTQATLTLPALATHEITASEILTSTVPAAVLTGGSPLVAAQTVTIVSDFGATVAGSLTESVNEHQVRNFWQTLDVFVTDTAFVSGQTFNDQKLNILAGVTSAQNEVNGWNTRLRDTGKTPHVQRLSDTHIRISYFAAPAYQISANETLTVTVPAGATTSGQAIVATPAITIASLSEINALTNSTATTDVPVNYEICDYSGFRAKPGELVETWDGHKVLPRFWEARHPQDFVRSKPDETHGSERPEQDDRFIEDEYPSGVSASDL